MTSSDSLTKLVLSIISPAVSKGNERARAESIDSAGGASFPGGEIASLQGLLNRRTSVSTEATVGAMEGAVASRASQGESLAAEVMRSATSNIAGSSFGSGLFISPILSGLLKLFGNSEPEPPTPLTHYSAPPAVHVDAGYRGNSGLVPISYGTAGRAREGSSQVQNITIQVQAMDGRSFLDRSSDIAGAVRRAMLESGVLNDVVSED